MTQKMLNFCIAYVSTHNASESSLVAGYSKQYAQKKSHLLLRNEEVKDKITCLEEKFYRDEFKKLALKSVRKLDDILSSTESESVQLGAVKLVLELAKVSDKSDTAQTIEIKVQLPNDL